MIKSASNHSNSIHVATPNNNSNSNLPSLDENNGAKRRSYMPNDYDAILNSSSTNDITELARSTSQVNVKSLSTVLMPHEKNALNYLLNEYLLEHGYKMTSVTFSEENETQDLEDWDVVGLNRAKPPKLYQLYRLYLNKNNLDEFGNKKKDEKPKKTIEFVDAETQAEPIETKSVETSTDVVTTKDFESSVNFDRDIFETQHTQIDKLLEKQDILLKSLAKLENEISGLNSERESHLRKIDYL